MSFRISHFAFHISLAALTATALAVDVTDWGFGPSRNMVQTAEKNPPTAWDCETGKSIKWIGDLGSKSYGNPIISQGIVWVGTNNEAKRDPALTADGGVLMAFRASDGKFLWQRYTSKLPTGRVNDWPGEGLCGTVTVEGDFLYYCTNRCELVCLDVSPLVKGTGEPKVVWSLDMIGKLGAFPHNATSAAPLIWKDYVYVITGNGVDETHKHLPAPNAPAVVCADKKTGKVIWTDNSPYDRVLHGQWSSCSFAEVNGQPLVIAPLGDGWIYAYDARDGKIVWKFDANAKETVYPTTKNELIATPVIVDNKMYIAVGQDPEHGEGPGHFWCVDITKKGDISKEIVDDAPRTLTGDEALVYAMAAKKGKPNPNSGVIWEYRVKPGVDKPKSKDRMNRSISTAAVFNGLVFVPDFSGYLHCFDAANGKHHWTYDMEAAMWGSPTVIDGKVYLVSEQGDVKIFAADKTLKVLAENSLKEKNADGTFERATLYCTPVFSNGTLYMMSRNKLFAIGEKK